MVGSIAMNLSPRRLYKNIFLNLLAKTVYTIELGKLDNAIELIACPVLYQCEFH